MDAVNDLAKSSALPASLVLHRRVGDGFMAVLMTMPMVVMIMFTATVRPMGVTGRFMAVIGRGVGSSTHDLNQARDCSHGQIASMPKPAA